MTHDLAVSSPWHFVAQTIQGQHTVKEKGAI